MLAEGEIDALLTARTPSTFTDGSGRVRRLYPDYRAAEQSYYRRTGFFPIMHTVVLRKDVVEAHPDAPLSLYRAFVQAKNLAIAALHESSSLPVTLPWLLAAVDEAEAILGKDYWPYGLERSRHEVEALVGFSHDQGLIPRRVSVDKLFAATTLDAPGI
jgi:4,5-dihydroxyphthalate decarboxylase